MTDYLMMLGLHAAELLSQREALRLLRPSRGRFYVYVLWRIDGSNPVPFYVGKGRERRLSAHLCPNARRANAIKDSILAKLHAASLKPLFSISDHDLDEPTALRREVRLIEIIGRVVDQSGPLANLSTGGDGCGSDLGPHGPKHPRARAVVLNGEPFSMLTEGARRLGLPLTTAYKRIMAGVPGYYFVDTGQLARTRPVRGSQDHLAAMWSRKRSRPQPVSIDGVVYPSFAAAGKQFGIGWAAIKQRCLNPRFPNYIRLS